MIEGLITIPAVGKEKPKIRASLADCRVRREVWTAWLVTGKGQGGSTEALGSRETGQFGRPAISFRINAKETSSEVQKYSNIPPPDFSPLTTRVWENGALKALQGFEEKLGAGKTEICKRYRQSLFSSISYAGSNPSLWLVL